MRIPLITDLKTRTGVPAGKDARQVNSYVEANENGQTLRKRPAARGGVTTNTGKAQGGIGLTIGNPATPTLYLFNGDIFGTYTSGIGTNWSSSTTYSSGDHVSVGFVDYWALGSTINNNPSSSQTFWSKNYVPYKNIWTWTQTGQCLAGISHTNFGTQLIAMNDFVVALNATPSCTGSGAYVYYVVTESTITYSYLGAPNVAPYVPAGLAFTFV